MAEPMRLRISVETLQKWCALAERRYAHLFELYQTGRWKLYYGDEHDFAARMREANQLSETWNGLASPPTKEKPATNT